MADYDVMVRSNVFWDWRVQMNNLLSRVLEYLYPRGHLAIDADDWVELLLLMPASLQHPLMPPLVIGTLHTVASRLDARAILDAWVAGN